MGIVPGSTQHLGPTQLGQKKNLKSLLPNKYTLDDYPHGLYLRTNQIKQICGLTTYMKHVFGSYISGIAPQDHPFHPFTPDEWSKQPLHT